jgi:hypothetical protein
MAHMKTKVWGFETFGGNVLVGCTTWQRHVLL